MLAKLTAKADGSPGEPGVAAAWSGAVTYGRTERRPPMLTPPAAALAAASLTLGATVLIAVTSGRTDPPPVSVELADKLPVVPPGPRFPMPVLRPDVLAYPMPVHTPDADRFPMPIVDPTSP